jgi:hypothetical protein
LLQEEMASPDGKTEASKLHHSLYVIRLDRAVLDVPRFSRAKSGYAV